MNNIIKIQKKFFTTKTFNLSFKSNSMVKDLIKPIGTTETIQESNTKRDSVIYKLKCGICESNNIISTYIGETGRTLQTRLNEHFRRIKDQVEFDNKNGNMSQIQKHMFLFHP